jgi:hypothetical protein
MLTIKAAIAATALSMVALSAGAATVSPADAMGQVGHTAKVCGIVAAANYAADTRGHPTFVTLIDPSQPNPAAALTAVIYGTDRANSETPKRCCQDSESA